ncbi:hypothetical protein DSL72_005998 [Monilinia vaccinii-corymbosi]|uniref:Cell wall protein n=1 Tax=Monilinia vaccinii-corymbosi TaxID=61207 RepID=A0A8A3PHF2_9HELO|nr:hypothetical protein DSL72_005998 [Monilinia vaccinii-corymbosi]
MHFSTVLLVLSTFTFSTALPVIRSTSTDGLTVRAENSQPTTAILSEYLTEYTAKIKATFSGRATSNKATSAKVQSAVSGFANDANTVSAALNQLPSMTNPIQIAALAKSAFNAESDEDSQRSVLFAAAGKAGASANTKIVQNTPAVLKGLKAMMQAPSALSVKYNVASIQAVRNPNILPSITALSNKALVAMGLPATAKAFPPTGSK